MQPEDNSTRITWEENTMKHRETLKLEFIHFQDNIFGILDPYLKMTMHLNNQIELISQENIRLMDLCKKNNVDTTIPTPKPEHIAAPPPRSEQLAGESPQEPKGTYKQSI